MTTTRMQSKPHYTDLAVGTAAPWYRSTNAIVCQQIWEEQHGLAKEQPKGWFAEIGWYNPMADYQYNSWEGTIVDGPFLTEEEAREAGDRYLAAQK